MDIIDVIVFVVVGIVVSFDVAGLTLSKVDDFYQKKLSLNTWCLWNAVWHAGLLALYTSVISVFVGLFIGLGNYIKKAFSFILDIFSFYITIPDFSIPLIDLFVEHAGIIFGTITVFIVWNIYSDKISGSPEIGDRNDLPPLAQFIYDILEYVGKVSERFISVVTGGNSRITPESVRTFLNIQAQSALVAVDMLALAALMQAQKYLETYEAKYTLIFIVFIIVFAISIGVGKLAIKSFSILSNNTSVYNNSNEKELKKNTLNWILVTLRIIEPFLIFYFLLELIAFLIFGERVHSIGFFFGSVVLIFGLISKNGLSTVIQKAIGEDEKNKSKDSNEENECNTKECAPPPKNAIKKAISYISFLLIGFPLINVEKIIDRDREPFEILKEIFFKSLYGWRIFVWSLYLILIALVFTYVIYDHPDEIYSLDSFLSKAIALILLLSSIFFFILIVVCLFEKTDKRIVKYLNKIQDIFSIIEKNRHVYLFVFGALTIVAITPIFDRIIGGRSNAIDDIVSTPAALGITINHMHALQASLYLIYFFILGMVFFHMPAPKKNDKDSNVTPHSNSKASIFILAVLLFSSVFFWKISYAQENIRKWYYDYLIKEQFNGFDVWVNCNENIAKLVYYELFPDSADFKKPQGYKLDKRENIISSCRQKTNDTYRSHQTEDSLQVEKFDVGNIVAANHMDFSERSIADSMFMENTFPQNSRFNQAGGAWKYTEELTECLREAGNLRIWAGTIQGYREGRKQFLKSHGVIIPQYAWKVIYRKRINIMQIYIMPNYQTSISSSMEKYVQDDINYLLEILDNDEVVAELTSKLKGVPVDSELWKYKKEERNFVCLGGSIRGDES